MFIFSSLGQSITIKLYKKKEYVFIYQTNHQKIKVIHISDMSKCFFSNKIDEYSYNKPYLQHYIEKQNDLNTF